MIALEAIDALPLLPFLFDSVLLPKAVRSELFRRRSTKSLIRRLLSQYAFLVRCDDSDRGAVDVLMAERHVRGAKDRGEVESVVQAAERSAMVVIDDPWAASLPAGSRSTFMEPCGFSKPSMHSACVLLLNCGVTSWS